MDERRACSVEGCNAVLDLTASPRYVTQVEVRISQKHNGFGFVAESAEFNELNLWQVVWVRQIGLQDDFSHHELNCLAEQFALRYVSAKLQFCGNQPIIH